MKTLSIVVSFIDSVMTGFLKGVIVSSLLVITFTLRDILAELRRRS